jgi:hypothetical protein
MHTDKACRCFICVHLCASVFPGPLADKDTDENGEDVAVDEAVWPLDRLRPYLCLARTGAKG